MSALDLIAALQRSHAVLEEAAIALAQAQAEIAAWRNAAAKAMAERDELKLEVLQLRVSRARAVA